MLFMLQCFNVDINETLLRCQSRLLDESTGSHVRSGMQTSKFYYTFLLLLAIKKSCFTIFTIDFNQFTRSESFDTFLITLLLQALCIIRLWEQNWSPSSVLYLEIKFFIFPCIMTQKSYLHWCSSTLNGSGRMSE